METMQEPLKRAKTQRDRLKVRAKCAACKRRLWRSERGLYCKNGHNNAPHNPATRTPRGTKSTQARASK
jgi:hypothetical protein